MVRWHWALLGAAGLCAAENESGCTITTKACKNFPEFGLKQFRDSVGEDYAGAGTNDAACFKRAEDFHHWCGNGVESGAQVAATFNQAQWSQVYHPGACEAGWSQWDAFCYKHYWEKKTWFEAEAYCRQKDSHLASVHSRAENRFIYTLTSGLSAWIGYTDLDQDTHFQWSDNTQDDFTNFAKNCTGREEEPDCKPEEKAQQWYDWRGDDRGTFVCKRNALIPISVLKNVTSRTLVQKAWGILLPALLAAGPALQGGLLSSKPLPALKLKTQEIPPDASADVKKDGAVPATPEPRLGLPKGGLLSALR